MRTDDYYQLLGVSRFVNQDVLRHAFRSAIRAAHPDHNPNDELATDRTRRIVEAYHVLGNPVSRQRYDRGLVVTEETPISTVTVSTPHGARWSFKAFTWVCLFALMAYMVFVITDLVFQSRGPVFRPSILGMRESIDIRSIPVIAEPDMADSLQWYFNRRYQMSLADEWSARQMLYAYDEAARRAAKLGDKSRARFYKSAPKIAPTLPSAIFL